MSNDVGHPWDSFAVGQATVHAVVLLDPAGLIVGWRGGAESIFGYAADEIVGRPSAQLFTPEDVARGMPELELTIALESGESSDDRWQVRKDGARIWAIGAVSPLYDEAGRHFGFVKILRNATDFKTRLEALEKRIAFLEESAGKKDVFIAELAHDLRNPLLVLQFGVEAIELAGGDKPQALRAATSMKKEIAFVHKLVDNLMESTQLARGNVELHRETVVFQELVREAAQGHAPAPGVTLQLLMPAAPIHVLVDPTRLRQVVTNLVQNAVKYTAAGNIWIKVSLDGEDAVLRVQDTGRGIAPEFMPHLFELFTQASPGETSARGIGLGLSTAHEIVRLHGGTLEAVSDGLNKGSTFIVRLQAVM